MTANLRLLCRVIAVLLLSGVAHAQTPVECVAPCALDAGKPFSLVWTHDPTATVTLPDGSVVTPVTTGYKIYLDGKILLATIPLSGLVAGEGSKDLSAPISVGTHTLIVSAYNPSVESRSTPLTFTVRAVAPTPPAGLRILITVTVGEHGELIFSVRQVPDPPAIR